MRLKYYGRYLEKRKEYIHQSLLILAGLEGSKQKYDGCVCIDRCDGKRALRRSSGLRVSKYLNGEF